MTSLRAVLASVGFHGHALDTAVAIALAESRGNPHAHNPDASTGDNSYGLFQINLLGPLGPDRRHRFHLSSNEDLFDPVTNARVAFRLSNGGTNWQPWTTFTGGTYRRYLGKDIDLDADIDTSSVTPSVAAPSDTAGDPMTDPATAPDFDIPTGQSISQVAAAHEIETRQKYLVAQLDYAAGLRTDPGPAPDTDAAPPSGPHAPPSGDALHTFLDAAAAQVGDRYVFGAKGDGQADPKAFDCSGLTKWAAHQAGVTLPDGAAHQYRALKTEGYLIPVEQAIRTPGALLFHFAREPRAGEGEPQIAHVAISRGDGRTYEAADPKDGVVSWHATTTRFNYAAVIPGIGTAPNLDDHLDSAPTTHHGHHVVIADPIGHGHNQLGHTFDHGHDRVHLLDGHDLGADPGHH